MSNDAVFIIGTFINMVALLFWCYCWAYSDYPIKTNVKINIGCGVLLIIGSAICMSVDRNISAVIGVFFSGFLIGESVVFHFLEKNQEVFRKVLADTADKAYLKGFNSGKKAAESITAHESHVRQEDTAHGKPRES